MNGLTRDKTAEARLARPNFEARDGYRENNFFAVKLITSRIDNLTRLMHTVAICDDHSYIDLYTK